MGPDWKSCDHVFGHNAFENNNVEIEAKVRWNLNLEKSSSKIND